jgi:hypothetical protein
VSHEQPVSTQWAVVNGPRHPFVPIHVLDAILKLEQKK